MELAAQWLWCLLDGDRIHDRWHAAGDAGWTKRGPQGLYFCITMLGKASVKGSV